VGTGTVSASEIDVTFFAAISTWNVSPSIDRPQL